MSVEVGIPQRYHRAVMGPKGCRIQHITREHEVQIKFPERDDSAAGQNHNTRKEFTCICNTAKAVNILPPVKEDRKLSMGIGFLVATAKKRNATKWHWIQLGFFVWEI